MPDLNSSQINRANELLNEISNSAWKNYPYSQLPSLAEYILTDGALSPEHLLKHNTVDEVGLSLHVQRLINQNKELQNMGV